MPSDQDGWLYLALVAVLALTALAVGIGGAKEARTGAGFLTWLLLGLSSSAAIVASAVFVLKFVAQANAWTHP